MNLLTKKRKKKVYGGAGEVWRDIITIEDVRRAFGRVKT
jgi:hypothetical protein